MIKYIACFLLIGLLACGGNDNNIHTPHKSPTPSLNSKNTTPRNKVIKPKLTIPKEQLDKAKSILSSANMDEVNQIDAKSIYKMRCGTCHGLKGNMDINGAKDLTKATLTLQESVAQIYFGKGVMLPHKNMLSEAEIIAVAMYVEKEFRK